MKKKKNFYNDTITISILTAKKRQSVIVTKLLQVKKLLWIQYYTT